MMLRRCFLAVTVGGAAVLGAPPPVPAGWTDGYVLANGIRLHYWRTGGAKPVMVLAHGSSDDGLCWANLAKELQGSYDLILFDARGHGLSDPPAAGDPADAQVEDLAGLIRALNLTKPILMGHSMGSASVAWFSAKYPDIPRAVILEDPNLGVRRQGAAPAGVATDPETRKQEMIARNNLTLDQHVGRCRTSNPKWEPSECEYWAPSKRRHHPNTTLIGMGGRPPMKELLPKITAPTLILKADAEGEVRTQNEETAKLLAKGRIVHIKGAGHNVRREGKAETLTVLKAFLASV
jgi:pimeloyl-ACP methyl ester carboxylesterase